MSSFNKVILVGNLTRDPELRYTPKGTAVLRGSLAVNRKWKSEDGEDREEVAFVDFDVWAKGAEIFAQYTKKGSAVLLEGRLKQESWEDKSSGQKRSKLLVLVESFQFLGGKSNGGEEREREKPGRASKEEEYAPGEERDDDVPF